MRGLTPRCGGQIDRLVILAALLLGATDGEAAGGRPPRIRDLVARSWQLEEGLPQNNVPAVVQTSDGYLWVGTQEGLARFDGLRFTVFSARTTPEFRQNRVFALVEDHKGDLWIATAGGLLRHHRGQFTAWTTEQGLSHDMVRALCACGDKLWIGTLGGLDLIENDKVSSVARELGIEGVFVRALASDPANHSLWIGTDTQGLLHYDGTAIQRYGSADGLPSDQIQSLEVDRQGAVWVATSSGLAVLRDGHLTRLSSADGLPADDVQVVYEDLDGTIWVGTTSGGLARFRNGELAVFGEEDGLSANNVGSILRDREGNLWVGTIGGGLDRLQSYGLTLLTVRDGLSSNVVSGVLEDSSGRIWAGTFEDGLNLLENGRFRTFTTRDGLPDDAIEGLWQSRDGALWVGTKNGGVARFKNGSFTVLSTANGLRHNEVRSVLEDRNGTMWIGTYGGGVTRIVDGGTNHLGSEDGLASDYVVSLFEDGNGAMWVGTDGGGLSRITAGGITTFGKGSPLEGAYVRTMLEDGSGTLWVGSSGNGLFRYRDGRFTRYTVREGLWSDKIFHIFDPSGTDLWMTGNQGVYRVEKKAFDDFDKGRTKSIPGEVYGREPGVGNLECNGGYTPAGWLGSDGRLWFGTVHGLAALDPARVRLEQVPPPVLIEGLIVDGVPRPVEGAFTLPPGEHTITFRYVGLNFTSPRALTYRYRLVGVDDNWIDVGDLHEVNYAHLKPGHYGFVVEACTSSGTCSSTPAAVAVTIERHLWQRRGFIGTMVALLIVAVYSVGRWRQGMRDRRDRERAELVRSLTVGMLHELRQPLQVVQSRLEVLELRPADMAGVLHDVFEQLDRLRSILLRLDELQHSSEVKITPYARGETMVDLSGTHQDPQ